METIIIRRCATSSNKIRNAPTETTASSLIPLWNSTITIKNTRSSFVHTTPTALKIALMVISAPMLTVRSRSYPFSFTTISRTTISICFTIRHSSALSISQNTINPSASMRTTGKTIAESQTNTSTSRL
jgi:hypothetical protein